MAAAFRAEGLGLIARHRAEPHGDRRRGEPLLARRAGMGAGEPLRRAGSTSTGRRRTRARGKVLVPVLGERLRLGARARRAGAAVRRRDGRLRGLGARDAQAAGLRRGTTGAILRAGGLDALAAAAEALADAAPDDPRFRRCGRRSRAARERADRAGARRLPRPAGAAGSWAALDGLIADAALAARRSSASTATRSTTGASSRSATSPGCGSRTRRSSRRRTRLALRAGRRGAGRRAPGRPRRRAARPEGVSAAAARAGGAAVLAARREDPRARRGAAGRTGASTAPPATRSRTCSSGSWSIRPARRR